MKKDDNIYLQHILDAIDLILQYIKGENFESFERNRMLQDAVIRELEIIGEASKNLSENIRGRYSDVPWKEMAGMRDKLIHAYFGVNLAAVWKTAA
jgi:uncharacterized protein with HEPN domain